MPILKSLTTLINISRFQPTLPIRQGIHSLADWRTGGLADWRTGGLAD